MGETVRVPLLRPSLHTASRDGVDLLIDPAAPGAGVLVAFSDRRGGVSDSPYDTLNLALGVGDAAPAVRDNRARVARAAGFSVAALAAARQAHGAEVMEVRRGESGIVGAADALVARAAGPVLTILSADCAPIVAAGPRAVGVFHAGWRGLVAGVVERGVEAVGEVAAAWVGPCIHACCYEVGGEVVEAFRARGLPVADESHVDCGRAAVFALHRAGVERVAASSDCTSCDKRYFSHRRDGRTGRQGAFVTRLTGG